MRLFGIEIRIHPSWLFIFVLIAWSLSSTLGPFGSLSVDPAARIALGLFATVLFFASVLAHELAHSLLARSRGVPVRGITLMVFGGVSQFGEEPRTPPSAAWIAAIGPLTSLAVAALFYGLALLAGPATPVGVVFRYLTAANVLLAIFNMIPALPLDGGRVLQALIWRATGDRLRATRIAAAIGRALAVVMIAYGVWGVVSFGALGGLWIAFIGWFLYQVAGSEEVRARLDSALQGHFVGELAVRPHESIPPDASIDRAFEAFANTQESLLPVMLGDRLLGVVSAPQVARARILHHGNDYVTSVMTRFEDTTPLRPEMRAIDALKALAEANVAAVPVVDKEGKFWGLISATAILGWVANERDHHVRNASTSIT